MPNDCLRNRKKKGENNKKNMETNLDGKRPETAYIDIKMYIYIYIQIRKLSKTKLKKQFYFGSVPPSEKTIHAQV